MKTKLTIAAIFIMGIVGGSVFTMGITHSKAENVVELNSPAPTSAPDSNPVISNPTNAPIVNPSGSCNSGNCATITTNSTPAPTSTPVPQPAGTQAPAQNKVVPPCQN